MKNLTDFKDAFKDLLIELITDSVEITTLSFEEQLTSEQIADLCIAIKYNTHLQMLNLSNQQITDAAIALLPNMLAKNQFLKEINLANNQISSKIANQIFLQIKNANKIIEINLSNNNIDTACFKVLQEISPLKLNKIILTGNPIFRDEGYQALLPLVQPTSNPPAVKRADSYSNEIRNKPRSKYYPLFKENFKKGTQLPEEKELVQFMEIDSADLCQLQALFVEFDAAKANKKDKEKKSNNSVPIKPQFPKHYFFDGEVLSKYELLAIALKIIENESQELDSRRNQEIIEQTGFTSLEKLFVIVGLTQTMETPANVGCTMVANMIHRLSNSKIMLSEKTGIKRPKKTEFGLEINEYTEVGRGSIIIKIPTQGPETLKQASIAAKWKQASDQVDIFKAAENQTGIIIDTRYEVHIDMEHGTFSIKNAKAKTYYTEQLSPAAQIRLFDAANYPDYFEKLDIETLITQFHNLYLAEETEINFPPFRKSFNRAKAATLAIERIDKIGIKKQKQQVFCDLELDKIPSGLIQNTDFNDLGIETLLLLLEKTDIAQENNQNRVHSAILSLLAKITLQALAEKLLTANINKNPLEDVKNTSSNLSPKQIEAIANSIINHSSEDIAKKVALLRGTWFSQWQNLPIKAQERHWVNLLDKINILEIVNTESYAKSTAHLICTPDETFPRKEIDFYIFAKNVLNIFNPIAYLFDISTKIAIKVSSNFYRSFSYTYQKELLALIDDNNSISSKDSMPEFAKYITTNNIDILFKNYLEDLITHQELIFKKFTQRLPQEFYDKYSITIEKHALHKRYLRISNIQYLLKNNPQLTIGQLQKSLNAYENVKYQSHDSATLTPQQAKKEFRTFVTENKFFTFALNEILHKNFSVFIDANFNFEKFANEINFSKLMFEIICNDLELNTKIKSKQFATLLKKESANFKSVILRDIGLYLAQLKIEELTIDNSSIDGDWLALFLNSFTQLKKLILKDLSKVAFQALLNFLKKAKNHSLTQIDLTEINQKTITQQMLNELAAVGKKHSAIELITLNNFLFSIETATVSTNPSWIQYGLSFFSQQPNNSRQLNINSSPRKTTNSRP